MGCAAPPLLPAAAMPGSLTLTHSPAPPPTPTPRMSSAPFPRVLDALKLKAFDMSRMVQSFVKHHPALPR